MSYLAALLALVILGILIARAIWIMRAEARQDNGGRPRGVRPGSGYTEVQSEYFSGLGGGSQSATRVPRDPQEYARAFVPRRAARRDHQTNGIQRSDGHG
ncbi:hypothetical protein JSE7799_00822 [Jannaschia seosinensis]|uniref:Uncharacterized protein n=1 Tax=Jannaschia seosinensis TaxID=313367 RepID=A0A0M7B5N8_9RHOB|nr:hypothetical protein [Jannaschia seosinensis]CUH28761.1 hypothetical protein JSE7799_00822 [Jannaschia seosinensis]